MTKIEKYACEFIEHKTDDDYLTFNNTLYNNTHLANILKKNIEKGGFNFGADFINFLGFIYKHSESFEEQEKFINKIKCKLHDTELLIESSKFDNFVLYKINLGGKWMNCVNKILSDFHIYVDDNELNINQIVDNIRFYANYIFIDVDSHMNFYMANNILEPVFKFKEHQCLYIGHINRDAYDINPEISDVCSDIYWSHDYMEGFELLCDIPNKNNIIRLNMSNENVIKIYNELSLTYNSYHMGPFNTKKIKLFLHK